MQFPRKVTVKGGDYQIDYVGSAQEADDTLQSNCYYGTASHVKSQILIDATFVPYKVLDTLAHEIIHCILERNKLLKAVLKPGIEEQFVDTIATELVHLLVTNKWVKLPKRVPITKKRIL
jgi:hypothetical protein